MKICGKNNSPKANTSNRNLLVEAVVQRFTVKKAFLEVLQNSQENTCARDYQYGSTTNQYGFTTKQGSNERYRPVFL